MYEYSCSSNNLFIIKIKPLEARLLPQFSLNGSFVMLVKINYFHIESPSVSANIGIAI